MSGNAKCTRARGPSARCGRSCWSVVPLERDSLEKRLSQILEGSDNTLSHRVPELFAEFRAAPEQMHRRTLGIFRKLLAVARGNNACRRLLGMRLVGMHGIGRQTASAALTAIGSGVTVDSGRDLSA